MTITKRYFALECQTDCLRSVQHVPPYHIPFYAHLCLFFYRWCFSLPRPGLVPSIVDLHCDGSGAGKGKGKQTGVDGDSYMLWCCCSSSRTAKSGIRESNFSSVYPAAVVANSPNVWTWAHTAWLLLFSPVSSGALSCRNVKLL